MWKNFSGFLAQLADKTVCFDVADNKRKELDKLNELVKEPENFKHRLLEFQLESAIMDRFATEKNNRLIVVMTFMLVLMTLVLLFKG